MAPAPVVGVTESTCIEGDFTGWTGGTLFELCNGEVWVQSFYEYTYHYAYRPGVLITQTPRGFLMLVEGVADGIYVQPVVDYVRSCVASDFNGWQGDTVFQLCNGQVWQQAEYRYTYHYAFRPAVMIYRAPVGGYRMRVDGINDTIGVRRLR